jgi:hypothetical protein
MTNLRFSGCIASIVSMALFFTMSGKPRASVQLMSWTLAEPGVLFVCACLPALWPLILLALSRLAVATERPHTKTDQYGYIGSRSGGVINLPSGNDDLISLNGIRDGVFESEGISTKAESGSQSVENSINVTTEFSWVVGGGGNKAHFESK